MSDASDRERPEKSPLDELKERVLGWLGELLHPPRLVPVPAPVRPSRGRPPR